MFQKSAISCLVIPRMEAILEYGCLDVVSLHPFSIGTESILRLASAFSICSLPKYFQTDFPFLSLTFTFHCSMLRVGIAVITSDVSLSVTSRVLSSIRLSSNRPGLPCIPLDTSSKPCSSSAASLRLSPLW